MPVKGSLMFNIHIPFTFIASDSMCEKWSESGQKELNEEEITLLCANH